MKQQITEKNTTRRPLAIQMAHRLREGLFILSIALSLFFFVSLCSYHNTDPGWSSTGTANVIGNLGGRAGAYLADIILSLFGCMAFLLPPLVVFAGWIGMRSKSDNSPFNLTDFLFKFLGFVLIIASGCGLTGIYFKTFVVALPAHFGGIVGDLLRAGLTHVFNVAGSTLFLVTAFLCGMTLFTGLSWLGVFDVLGAQVTRLASMLWQIRIKKTDYPCR